MNCHNKNELDIALFCDARSVHFKKWTKALDSRGHKLRVFSPWQGNTAGDDLQVLSTRPAPFPLPTLVRTLGKITMRAKNGKRIKKQLIENPPDIVHAHYLLDAGWMAAQLDFHPFIVTIHGSDLLVYPETSRLYRFIVRKVLTACDIVVIVGEHFRELLKQYGVSDEKVRFVPSFIDTKIFHPIKKRHQKDKVIIGSARNFEKIYDVLTFLKAIPIILEKHSNIQVQIAGDGSLKPQLIQLVNDLGLSEKVEFLGRLTQSEMGDFFKRIDIYVSTALSDGVSVTLLEACACGTVPVVTNIPGNHYAFSYGLKGEFFEPENSKDLAAKLVKVCEDFDLKVGENNARIISRIFEKDVVVKKMEQIYWDAIS